MGNLGDEAGNDVNVQNQSGNTGNQGMQRTGNRNERNNGENLGIGVELMSYNKNKRKCSHS